MVSAQGYTKAILNEGSFVDLPGADGQLVRHYRTRDLARWTRDGALEYCGRADGFAKVGGKWLDLASVERKLQEAGCKEAALLWDEEYKVRHAVVVLTDAKLECSLAAQVAQLEAHLPPQTCLHLLQSLPKNAATGKVARAALLKELRQEEAPCVLSGSSPSSSSRRPRPPKSPVSRSLLLGLVLAAGLRRSSQAVQAGKLPLALALAPGLLELIWQGNGDEALPKLQNGVLRVNGVQAESQGSCGSGAAVRTRRSLVPRGVAERLTSWLAWYRSITLLLSPEQLDALPFICLLLIDGCRTGLADFVRVIQMPLGLLGCGALLAASSLPSTWLLAAAGRLWARRERGGSGWLWVFWLGFPSFADSWSGAVWSAWPRGAPCYQGAWQAVQGIVAATQPTKREEDRYPELSRCSHCWDWVATTSCTTWRRRTYCSDCTEGWEAYQATRRRQTGEDEPELTPRSDTSYWTTPSGTPSGTPATTPRAVDATQESSPAVGAAAMQAPRKKGRAVVDVIDFAEYEVSLARSRRPKPPQGKAVQESMSIICAMSDGRFVAPKTCSMVTTAYDDGMASALRLAKFPTSEEATSAFQHSLLVSSERLRLDAQRSRALVAMEESIQNAWKLKSRQLQQAKEKPEEAAVPPPPPPALVEPPLTEMAPEEEEEEDVGENGGEAHSIFQGSVSLEDQRRIEEFSLYDPRDGKLRDLTFDDQVARRKKLTEEWAKIVQEEKAEMKKNPRKAFAVQAPNLEDAFYLIAAAYDLNGNGLLDDYEVLTVLDRCKLLDSKLTATKIKSFFRTWAVGCNKIIGENLNAEDIEDGIGYEEFTSLLHWIADMKGIPLTRCRARVIRLSHKMVVDSRSSVKRRLALLFDGFCKREAEWMSPHEFTNLCHTTNLYKQGVFSAGDAFKIFYQTPGLENQRMDFAGFMHAIQQVGEMFGKSEAQSAEMFAAAVGRMDTDEETVRRIKLRIKHAASVHGENGWREFFHECDQDQSGYMDIDEFLDMCRHKLHLDDRKSHLQLLFERLDEDDSGELSIDEIIAFMVENGTSSSSRVAQVLERATGLQGSHLSGLESLKVIILVSALRRELGVNLAAGEVLQCDTLEDLEALVEASDARPDAHDESGAGSYPIYAIPRFWKAPVGWLIQLDDIPDQKAMRVACRALVQRHVSLRAAPYRLAGDEVTASMCLGAASVLVVLRALLGVPEVGRGPALSTGAGKGLLAAWPRVATSPASGGPPLCQTGGMEETANFEWLCFETAADLHHAAWLKARSRGFKPPASISVLLLKSASSAGKDLAYLHVAVNHAVTDAACIVPLVADLLALHDAARECNGDGGDLEASARAALARSALPPAPDGLQIAQARLSTALLPELIEGLDDRLDLAHNGCPPRKRGYDHYVKLLPNAGRVLEAAAGVTGIPTDHLLVAALASALSSAANLAQVKLSLIVPMRDGPGHGQAVANLASTRHLSVRLRGRSLIDIALDLSMRFRRRDWQLSQLLDDDGDRLFINLRSIPVFDGASPVIEPQDTTRSPTRFVRNIVEMFADQETLYSWTLWLGLREDVCGEAFSRALRRALWGFATSPLRALEAT
ncbi:srfAC [Symbiodinium sp. KB8]|nr:srfAC [Symbiodinium sp. KB8]